MNNNRKHNDVDGIESLTKDKKAQFPNSLVKRAPGKKQHSARSIGRWPPSVAQRLSDMNPAHRFFA